MAREKKEKLAKKEAKTKKKKVVNLKKGHTGEPQDENKSPRVGMTNAFFYPIYQQTMNRLSIEFVIRMKEERDSSLYSQYIKKVIQHVGAADTSVQDIDVQDVTQTIKDKDCRFITGLNDSKSEDDDGDDNVIGLVDVMKTFDKAELTRTICDQISHCFENLAEAHAMMKEAFIDTSHLVHVLPKKGLALLLEAMATGSIVVQDTKAFNVLQEVKIHRRIRDEIKAEEGKRCAIDLQLEKWKNCMLPSWRHSIFYHSSKRVKIGKVVAAITVYLRFALGEKPREVPLVTAGKQFPIGQ